MLRWSLSPSSLISVLKALTSPLGPSTSASILLILVAETSVNSLVFRPRVVNVFAIRAVRGNLRVDERKV